MGQKGTGKTPEMTTYDRPGGGMLKGRVVGAHRQISSRGKTREGSQTLIQKTNHGSKGELERRSHFPSTKSGELPKKIKKATIKKKR